MDVQCDGRRMVPEQGSGIRGQGSEKQKNGTRRRKVRGVLRTNARVSGRFGSVAGSVGNGRRRLAAGRGIHTKEEWYGNCATPRSGESSRTVDQESRRKQGVREERRRKLHHEVHEEHEERKEGGGTNGEEILGWRNRRLWVGYWGEGSAGRLAWVGNNQAI